MLRFLALDEGYILFPGYEAYKFLLRLQNRVNRAQIAILHDLTHKPHSTIFFMMIFGFLAQNYFRYHML